MIHVYSENLYLETSKGWQATLMLEVQLTLMLGGQATTIGTNKKWSHSAGNHIEQVK